jgi:hypothetical protein
MYVRNETPKPCFFSFFWGKFLSCCELWWVVEYSIDSHDWVYYTTTDSNFCALLTGLMNLKLLKLTDYDFVNRGFFFLHVFVGTSELTHLRHRCTWNDKALKFRWFHKHVRQQPEHLLCTLWHCKVNHVMHSLKLITVTKIRNDQHDS